MNLLTEMKSIFVLSICLLNFALLASAQADEVREFIMEIAKRCQTDSITEKDIEAIMENSTPSYEGKCFIACTMKELQLISEDGKFISDGVVKLNEKARGENNNSEEVIRLSEAIAEKCSDMEGEDECELAFNLYRCGKAEYEASRE